jgi:hypothetical protein
LFQQGLQTANQLHTTKWLTSIK